jgi:hypothetical protein
VKVGCVANHLISLATVFSSEKSNAEIYVLRRSFPVYGEDSFSSPHLSRLIGASSLALLDRCPHRFAIGQHEQRRSLLFLIAWAYEAVSIGQGVAAALPAPRQPHEDHPQTKKFSTLLRKNPQQQHGPLGIEILRTFINSGLSFPSNIRK